MKNKKIWEMVNDSLKNLTQYIEREDFRGYDPYDGLNSPILSFLSFNSKYPRIAFTQAMKRVPLNLRPFLFIKKGLNPKGLGLFLWGYVKLYALEKKLDKKEEYMRCIRRLLNLLEETRSQGYSGFCWGYNFDWQSRAFFVPKYTPTIVNSSFIGHALIDTYLYTGNKKALEMAVSIKEFILNDLNRKEEDGTICFSYTPIDTTSVHNANLLGASFLIRLYRYTRDEGLKDTAISSLAYTLKYQNDDGSWYYAETDYQKWIDSFHTGFNLQSIHYFLEEDFDDNVNYRFLKGVEFYKNSFFLNNGTPKYYHNRVYPIDIHSPAQAIVLFSRLGKDYKKFTELILTWMINNLQDSKGYFYFQKTKRFINKIPYIRWGQAWAFHALTEFMFFHWEVISC